MYNFLGMTHLLRYEFATFVTDSLSIRSWVTSSEIPKRVTNASESDKIQLRCHGMHYDFVAN